jgi:uncharacterized membrane protein
MLLIDVDALIGHLHPLLVHLPIGFLLIAIFLDLAAYRSSWAAYRPAVPLTLLLGFIAAGLSCISGYVLSLSGDYALQSLSLHQWGGVVVAGWSGLLCWIQPWLAKSNWKNRGSVFTSLLVLLGVFLAYTGHQGGSLTHGSHYLAFNPTTVNEAKNGHVIEAATAAVDVPKVNPDLPLKVDSIAIQKLRVLGCQVRVMLQQPVMLDVTLPSQSGKNMAELTPHLQVLAESIVWLNLSDNGLSEKDLAFLPKLRNLEKLRLEKNPIGDGIAGLLGGAKHLEALNLNETQISKIGLEELRKNPALKRIYWWHTAAEGQ